MPAVELYDQSPQWRLLKYEVIFGQILSSEPLGDQAVPPPSNTQTPYAVYLPVMLKKY